MNESISFEPWETDLAHRLDAALAADEPPAGLIRRVTARCREAAGHPRPVRWSGQWVGWRIAAAVVLAAGAGVAAIFGPGPAANTAAPTVTVAGIAQQLNQLALIEQPPATDLDRQIDQLQAQVALATQAAMWTSPPEAALAVDVVPAAAMGPSGM